MNIASDIKQTILENMQVLNQFSVHEDMEHRIRFIEQQLKDSGMNTLVLGISGGVDSSVCGKLCQLAVEKLRQAHPERPYQFIAVRLPYGVQKDAEDAEHALEFIQPDLRLSVNIQSSVDALHDAILQSTQHKAHHLTPKHIDFTKGNTKARLRMSAQYQIAGLYGGLVVGTDHSAENVTGFYTKFGDGACDLAPLFGLNKRQIRAIAKHLDAPESLIHKVPTADLECNAPLQADEEALGVTYDQIDDFLEGKSIDKDIEERIINIYLKTEHKRQEIPTPSHLSQQD